MKLDRGVACAGRLLFASALALSAQAAAAEPARRATLDLDPRYREQAQKYDIETRRLLRTDGAARRDGYLYGMDVAPLLAYAAERGDAELYKDLLPHARKLILGADSGTFTEGFVLWRHKPGVKPEVSGATEAGWMARALWTGAQAFNRAEDRALARKILDGYARHAFEQNNTWFVRKYYAFGANAFANLSVLGNYQPDFLADAERAGGGAAWRGMAERSYALLERALSPSRLLYPLVVPEIGATWPGQGVDVFAPNGLVALEDSCDAAEAAVRGRPKLGKGVLKFAGARGHRNAFGRLHAYYDANDGDPRGEQSLSTTGYACLGRLAAMLDDDGAWERLEPQLLADMGTLPTMALSNDAPLYSAGPLLLTAWAAGALNPPQP